MELRFLLPYIENFIKKNSDKNMLVQNKLYTHACINKNIYQIEELESSLSWLSTR